MQARLEERSVQHSVLIKLTFGLQSVGELVPQAGVGQAVCEEGPAAAHLREQPGEVPLEVMQPPLEHRARLAHALQQPLLADHGQNALQQDQLARVTHPRVEDAVRLRRPGSNIRNC